MAVHYMLCTSDNGVHLTAKLLLWSGWGQVPVAGGLTSTFFYSPELIAFAFPNLFVSAINWSNIGSPLHGQAAFDQASLFHARPPKLPDSAG
eukprot:1153850-Pelagomonas_calceolata.AAC.3